MARTQPRLPLTCPESQKKIVILYFRDQYTICLKSLRESNVYGDITGTSETYRPDFRGSIFIGRKLLIAYAWVNENPEKGAASLVGAVVDAMYGERAFDLPEDCSPDFRIYKSPGSLTKYMFSGILSVYGKEYTVILNTQKNQRGEKVLVGRIYEKN